MFSDEELAAWAESILDGGRMDLHYPGLSADDLQRCKEALETAVMERGPSAIADAHLAEIAALGG